MVHGRDRLDLLADRLAHPRPDNLNNARATFGVTYAIARAASLALHFDAACILLPVCRNFISLLRRTPLAAVVPFDSNITFRARCD